jgi:hypothetical protein
MRPRLSDHEPLLASSRADAGRGSGSSSPRNAASTDQNQRSHQRARANAQGWVRAGSLEHGDALFALPLPEEIAAFQAAILSDAAERERVHVSAGHSLQGDSAPEIMRERDREQAVPYLGRWPGMGQGGEAEREHLGMMSRHVDDEALAADLQVRLFLADEYEAPPQDEEVQTGQPPWHTGDLAETRRRVGPFSPAPLAPHHGVLAADEVRLSGGQSDPQTLHWHPDGERGRSRWPDERRGVGGGGGVSPRTPLSASSSSRSGAGASPAGWQGGEDEQEDMSYERLLELDSGVVRPGLKPAQLDKLARVATRSPRRLVLCAASVWPYHCVHVQREEEIAKQLILREEG